MVDQMVDGTVVLAIEDDDMNLEMLDVILSSADCRILKACNGVEAIRLLDLNPDIDVILVDLEMPVLDGYKLISYVKQSLQYRLIPVIVMTGNTNEVNRTLTMGASDFIPVSYTHLTLPTIYAV